MRYRCLCVIETGVEAATFAATTLAHCTPLDSGRLRDERSPNRTTVSNLGQSLRSGAPALRRCGPRPTRRRRAWRVASIRSRSAYQGPGPGGAPLSRGPTGLHVSLLLDGPDGPPLCFALCTVPMVTTARAVRVSHSTGTIRLMKTIPLEIVGELRVVTTNSVWLVRADRYCRMPRIEAPRRASSPAMVDAVWHPHVGAWLVLERPGPCIRLLPPDRPVGAHGIVTGTIITCEPADLLRAASTRPRGFE